ncbi:MAG: exo-alpha-sialidase, partial [Bacteroidota bacterium]
MKRNKLSQGRFIVMITFVLVGCYSENKENDRKLELMRSPVGINSEEPYLISTEGGKTYLSWIEKADSSASLFYAQLANGQWSNPIKIAEGNNWFVNWADYPMISKNGDNYIAHYLAKSGEGTYAYDVIYTQSKDGQFWSEGKKLNEDNLEAEHGFVSMLPFHEHFLLAWLDGRNTVGNSGHDGHDHSESKGAMTLRAAIVDVDGNKKQEWQLDNRICDCCQTSTAMTDNGPIVVYRDRSENEIRDMSIVRLVNGEWTQPKTIHSDRWKINGCPVNGPRADAINNTLAIAWFTGADDSPKVKLIFSLDGGESFLDPVEIAGEGSIGRVDVVMKDERSAFISWMEGMDIQMMSVDIEGNKSEINKIASSSESRSSGFPQMSKDNDQLIFAWTSDSLTFGESSAPVNHAIAN